MTRHWLVYIPTIRGPRPQLVHKIDADLERRALPNGVIPITNAEMAVTVASGSELLVDALARRHPYRAASLAVA